MFELKMYVFINFELSLIVNMLLLLRIWIKHMRLRAYDTANRLADDAGRQKKVTIQNVRDVLERVGGIIKPKYKSSTNFHRN